MYRNYCKTILTDNSYKDLFAIDYDKMVDECLNEWEEPQRIYHNIQNHLYQMFLHIGGMKIGKLDKDMFYLAALFHDVIYVTTKTDNEEQSTARFMRYVKVEYTHSLIVKTIREMIMATKTFSSDNTIARMFVLLDIKNIIHPDIHISIPIRDALLVRKEYSKVPDVQFIKGNNKVLDRLVNSDIVRTNFPEAQERVDEIKEVRNYCIEHGIESIEQFFNVSLPKHGLM